MSKFKTLTVLACSLLLATACSNDKISSNSRGSSPTIDDDNPLYDVEPRQIFISPGPDATLNALAAFVSVRPGDTIEFGCGYFDIESTLLLTGRLAESITIKGCGIDETVLSFRNSPGVEGLLMDSVRNVTVQDLTVADTDGNGFELRGVNHGTLRNVRAFWSSNGGRESPTPISADNYNQPYTDNGGDIRANPMDIACTAPATLNPAVAENNGRPETLSPDYTVSDKSGRYGIYPVKSRNILVDSSESIGASDAGIYVGQTSIAKITNSRAAYNVFGFEIENVRHGEYSDNLGECNTGGFLIYDLDNITQYGERTIMHDNIVRKNNTYNFTEGGFVANVPPGSGMVTLSYDRIDVYDNHFEENNTGGIIHVSYELFPEGAGRPNDRKIDFYTEGLRIFGNTFKNNGNLLPDTTTSDLQNQDVARLLPAVLGLKNQAACAVSPKNMELCAAASQANPSGRAATGYRGAHIVWDGLLPEYNAECPYPVDNDGNPVPEEETFPGKPRHTNEHPNPDCHYNKYKFDDSDLANPIRLQPLFGSSCIGTNTFSSDSLAFSNFNGIKGVGAAIAIASGTQPTLEQITESQQFPADLDLEAHNGNGNCDDPLTRIPPVEFETFVPSEFDAPATAAEIKALCEGGSGGSVVNFAAGDVDCPRLEQYNLFADAEDPRSTPNGNGVPFVLNSKLFSDYSTKYRVMFLPEGTKATYMAPGAESTNATLVFPVGTIVAKSFAFPENNGTTEKVAETRLLIKRSDSSGFVEWAPLEYQWFDKPDGGREARLAQSGATIAASWDYTDPESGERFTGSTTTYTLPNRGQCIQCHANADLESGAAPIGTKVRNMNRAYRSDSPFETDQGNHRIQGQNQIKYLCDNGYLAGCPTILDSDLDANYNATNLERVPKFNKPGDSGFVANSDKDIEARARAWLEVNCAHCHNDQGFAANTGFYTDIYRRVDQSHGICKGPTAAGAEGSDGRRFDIVPAQAADSILEFRISPDATSPAARMPPIGRSVVDIQGHALIKQWIDEVILKDEDKYPGSTACGE
jgi:parallel beta-helix repeat protein